MIEEESIVLAAYRVETQNVKSHVQLMSLAFEQCVFACGSAWHFFTTNIFKDTYGMHCCSVPFYSILVCEDLVVKRGHAWSCTNTQCSNVSEMNCTYVLYYFVYMHSTGCTWSTEHFEYSLSSSVVILLLLSNGCHISNHPCIDTQENADLIAAAVKVEYESLGPVITSTEDAVRANSYIENYKPVVIQVGDATGEYKI